MDKIAEIWGSVPQGVQWALAGIGALYAAKGVTSILQFILQTFLLSGTNVSPGRTKSAYVVILTYSGD